jgi:beta-galactosidase/beta-glucuronidase
VFTSQHDADETVTLVEHGVDTIATTRLNGIILVHNANMFVTYTTSVQYALRQGSNTLTVEFMPARVYALRESDAFQVRACCLSGYSLALLTPMFLRLSLL